MAHAMRWSVHPLCVFLGACVFLVSLLLVSSAIKLIVLFIIYLIVFISSHMNARDMSTPVLRAWPLLLMTFVLHAVISSRNVGVFTNAAGAGSALGHGLGTAALFTTRLALMLLTVTVVFRLHPAQRYGQAVGKLFSRLPFARGTLAQLELAGTLALRFVPFVGSEATRLRMALAARGETFAGNRPARWLATRKLLFPLMVSALRRADHVADALAVRGYNPEVIKTSLRATPVKMNQLAATGLFTLICLAVPWI